MGWYIGGCIAAGTLTGRWLDSKLDTGPILVVTGLVLGSIVAFLGVYHMLVPNKGNQRDKENS